MTTTSMTIVKVPDIGGFKDVPVIDIHVKPGDTISPEAPLVTLESDKAAMEVPAPFAGKVANVLVRIGDKVSEGTPIIEMDDGEGAPNREKQVAAPDVEKRSVGERLAEPVSTPTAPSPAIQPQRMPVVGLPPLVDFSGVHASPSVRRLARELDIDLRNVKGTGENGRITKDDVKRSVGGALVGGARTNGSGIPEIPAQDFSKFGPTEEKPLSRLKRLSGTHLHRAWLNIPHVTHCDEADITELDNYRKMLDSAAKDNDFRVTLLSFLLKASVVALKEHPEFNASLSPDKASMICKKYYHIGVAVDTPDGLVVPVIKDVDRKGILELSQELTNTSKKMREGKIAPADIQGATFSISSLGGIGGTAFTPIVNAPEVAILGVVRSSMKPVWDGNAFQPRLMLPLCVSYDHRIIDGALAARFTRHMAKVLTDVRQMVL